MDLKDKQIINQLQINGKISNIDLAEKVNLSPSPCLRRVKILEDKGIILSLIHISEPTRPY